MSEAIKAPWWEEYPLRIPARKACTPEVLNISYVTFRTNRSAGKLPFDTHRDGKFVYIYTDDLLEHLNSFRLPKE